MVFQISSFEEQIAIEPKTIVPIKTVPSPAAR